MDEWMMDEWIIYGWMDDEWMNDGCMYGWIRGGNISNYVATTELHIDSAPWWSFLNHKRENLHPFCLVPALNSLRFKCLLDTLKGIYNNGYFVLTHINEPC